MRKTRSMLYVPASNERALAKLANLDADGIILDLEDSVAPENKVRARQNARNIIESGVLGGKTVVVRVNGLASDEADTLFADDLDIISQAAPDALLIPKIRTAVDVEKVEGAMNAQFLPEKTALWLMIETPQAIMNLREIADRTRFPRLGALALGHNDLAKEMRIGLPDSRVALFHAISTTVLAARAAGLRVFDSVFGAFTDQEGFERECRHGKGLGFDGKTLIHPSQIEAANRWYSPSEAEIAHARQVVAAFDMPGNAERGVISIGGVMVERLHLAMARDVLAMAE